MASSSKHLSTALGCALSVLGVVYTVGCSSASSATRQSGGGNGAATVIVSGGTGGGTIGGVNDAATAIGGAAGGDSDAASAIGGAAGGDNDAATTIGGAGGDNDAEATIGGQAGSADTIFGEAGGASSMCEIGLQEFENNGYRSCSANDVAEIAGDCGPEFNNEYGDTETCGAFRIHAYGHDGRIGCAYDSTTGTLVGGFLYGIPVPGMSCSSYFAGPAELATCPIPNTPFCRAAP